MEVNSKNLRDVESIQLSDSITSIDCCVDFIAAGCLDDTVYIWQKDISNFKKDPFFTRSGNAMGIVDLAFNKKSTQLATSCMDSTIRIYDLHTFELSTIECQVMQNWKIQCVDDSIVTGGDYGRINFYDITSKERVKKVDVGEIFLTALAQSQERGFIAAGNNNGAVYIININKSTGNKEYILSLNPHHRLVRELCFIDNDQKLLSASDDGSIGMVDISSQKVVHNFQGHKLAVSSVSPHQNDQRIFFSTSFDKTVKIWDLRTKGCVGTAVTGSPLWDCKSMGTNLIVGGENGVLILYSVE